MAESGTIETERLSITPFKEEHLTERYVNWLNDPEVVRYSEQRFRSHTLKSCREYWKSFQNSPNYFWAVVVKNPAFGHIGNITATVVAEDSLADVAIMIGEKKAWGFGYAAEAWVTACRYLLLEAGMRKVTCGTLAANALMRRLIQRTGMVEDGRRIRQVIWNDQEVDIVYAALFRENLS